MDPLIDPWTTSAPGAHFHAIFEMADEPKGLTIGVEGESRDALIATVCGWIASGLVPVTMPDGAVWLRLHDAS